jgi:two-component system CheB/CheR fusion protein
LRHDLGSARAELAIALRALEFSSERWLAVARQTLAARSETAANDLAGLTPRQRQIMELVLDGQPSKNIAADLGVSRRTIENHRASIMRKMHSKSLPALTRCAIAATGR